MNFYITLKRAIVYAPFTAARAIGTAYSRFNPPLSTSVNLAKVGILLALLVISFTYCWIPVATAQNNVNIPDEHLAAAVRTALFLDPGDPIPEADLAGLQALLIYAPADPMEKIKDLTGLEYATRLVTLSIEPHDIRSLEPIKDLTTLKYLRFTGSENLGDISPIRGLTNLEELQLGNTGISDITPLANLTNLEHLDLKNNQIQDISALANLTKLTYLNLWNKRDDFVPLSRGNNQIRDIRPLANMTELIYLYLDGNQISDLTPLANLTELILLEIQDNQVRDISPLTRIAHKLRTLYLQGNPLSYRSIYTHLPNIQDRLEDQSRRNYVTFATESGRPTRIPESLVSISGDEQTGMSGVQLAAPFVVETRDSEGAVFAGVPLTFAITEGGGTLTPVPTETDDDGRAEATLTPVTTLGRHTVAVTVIHDGTTLRTAFTADVLPIALAAPTLSDASPTTLQVSWVAPAYPVEGYEVRYRVKDSEAWTDATHEGTGTSITLTDLIPGTAYEAQIRAQTTVGPSPWSPSVSGMTAYVLLTTRELAPSPVASDRLVFNELRNADDDKHDWLEVKNISDADISLAGWEISIVASAGGAANQDVDIIAFPAYTLPAGEVLLIVNTSPSQTDLASGVNIATGTGKKGARHRYLIAADMKLPSTQYLLLLRSVTDKNGTAEALEDVAGNYFRETGDFLFGDEGTQVWPLQDTERPSPNDAAPLAVDEAWARVSTEERGYFAAAWSQRGYQAGLGYKRGAGAATSFGTPGYPNTAVTEEAPSGRVSISELMFSTKSGRRTVPQWIELYNNSTTDAVKLEGWRLEVKYLTGKPARRHRFDAVSLTPLTVLPNQTVLLVTWRAETSGHFPEGRLYNLYFEHPNAFNQRERRNDVLNAAGFSVRLLDAAGTLVDSVGNLDGVARTKDAPTWDVPSGTTADGARVSLLRKYEDSAPLSGTEADSWVSASEVKLAVSTYYGWETDLGTPGYRDGGPLPVVLSQFQSVRTDAGVVIRWTTESSVDNAGFNLLRSESRPGPFTQINRGLIAGAGTTGERQTYTFTDSAAKPRVSYYYRLEEVSFGGVRQVLATTRVRGHVTASGKLTTRWSQLKSPSVP